MPLTMVKNKVLAKLSKRLQCGTSRYTGLFKHQAVHLTCDVSINVLTELYQLSICNTPDPQENCHLNVKKLPKT